MEKNIVIDNGTATTKVGFSGEDVPKLIFPTIIGKDDDMEEIFLHPAKKRLSSTSRYYPNPEIDSDDLIFPMQKGVVLDWEAMERIWKYIFKELRVCPYKHPVLMTEPPLNTNKNRVKTAEIMFEVFGVPALSFMIQPVLSAYATGCTSACVVEIGEITHVVPVVEGLAIKHAIKTLDLGGKDIDLYLQSLLAEKEISPKEELNIKKYSRYIKEQLCYLTSDVNREIKYSQREYAFMFPDGDVMTLNHERFLAPECLFEPIKIKKDIEPLQTAIISALSECDEDIKRNLYSYIVLSGGTSKLWGIKYRLHREIKNSLRGDYDVRIFGYPSDRSLDVLEYSAWKGGSNVADLGSFEDILITVKEYKKKGPDVFNLDDAQYHKEEIEREELESDSFKDSDLHLRREVQSLLDWANDEKGLPGYINYYLQEDNRKIISQLAEIYEEFRRIFDLNDN